MPFTSSGKFTYMLAVAIVCCCPPEGPLTRTGWRMALITTWLIGMRRVSARPCTSSIVMLAVSGREVIVMLIVLRRGIAVAVGVAALKRTPDAGGKESTKKADAAPCLGPSLIEGRADAILCAGSNPLRRLQP